MKQREDLPVQSTPGKFEGWSSVVGMFQAAGSRSLGRDGAGRWGRGGHHRTRRLDGGGGVWGRHHMGHSGGGLDVIAARGWVGIGRRRLGAGREFRDSELMRFIHPSLMKINHGFSTN